MDRRELFKEILNTYDRHGWKLARVLLTPAAQSDLKSDLPAGVSTTESDIDALWFARPSHAGREAWELRLLAENQYALFEAFEADEAESERTEARLEMENKLREYVSR